MITDLKSDKVVGSLIHYYRSESVWVLVFNQIIYHVHKEAEGFKYSRIPLTRTLKGSENLFELAGYRVIGVD